MTTEKRRSTLVSKPNYHTTKHVSENLLAIGMKKTKVTMDKPIYLGEVILDSSKTDICEFWYDYIKHKYGDRVRPCYTNTDSLLPILKLKIFLKILVMMLMDGLMHLTMMKTIKDHFQ